MLVPLWGIQALNVHICMELPACCVWLPLEPQLEWKHQTSWQTFHTTTGCDPGVRSQPGPADCWRPVMYWPSPALRIPEQHICSTHQRGGSRAVIFGFMPVFMCRPWDPGPELEEAGLNRSNATAHANGQRSIPPGPRLSICSFVHVIKNATRNLCIRPAFSPCFHV